MLTTLYNDSRLAALTPPLANECVPPDYNDCRIHLAKIWPGRESETLTFHGNKQVCNTFTPQIKGIPEDTFTTYLNVY